MNVNIIPGTKATRARISLDGEWQFRHETSDWRTIMVPGVWQAQFEDLRLTGGTALYRRRFALPQRRDSRELALHFDAVSYLAEVYLNGRRLGAHEGGWLPFEFILDSADLRDDNELEVRVVLPSSAADRPLGQPSFAEIPHGKQSWYGPLAGIWQPVWLEQRDRLHIRGCRIRADFVTATVNAEVRLSLADEDIAVSAAIICPNRKRLAEARAVPSDARANLHLVIPDPLPWSPAAPHLHRLELELTRAGRVIDVWSETFGFRTIVVRAGRFLLNGAPLYLRGALDQDYYAESLAAPPSLDLLEKQMRTAKAMGLNCLRCHIKVPDPHYYDVADRLGMLIWAEIPNIAEFSDAAAKRLWATMEDILDRDGNHPSIIAWTIVNEDWGTHLDADPEHRVWLADAYARLKALDGTRLVVDNSPCFPNFHVRTDINDFHYYRAIPDHRDEWDWITEQFASRPSWTFAPDGRQTGEEPLVVSEFGVWGLPHPDNLRDAAGREPWWFETGELFGDGVAYPHGAERRFHLMALDRVFGSFDAFIKATQWHQFAALKYQIEKLREHDSIQGYVVTELTDVFWEANGLMDMQRNPRLFAGAFADLNTDLVILPRLDRFAFWCGQPIRLSPTVATGGERLEHGGIVDWSLEPGGRSGRRDVPVAEPCTLAPIMPVEFTAPMLDLPAMAELRMVLRDHNGRERARTSTNVALYPQRQPQALPSIWTIDEELATLFRGLGYANAATPRSADLIVVRAIDTGDVEAIRTGARYLLFADGPGMDGWLRSDHPVQAAVPTMPAPVNPPFPGIMRRVRRGNVWRGDWITNFGWLARRGPFADIPGGPLLDLSFDRVAPAHVLWASVRPWEYEAGIMSAGVVVGWVHKPAGFIMERRFGRGRLVMSSFRLTRDPPGVDPVATALLDRLVQAALAL
jgi:hypothetical protein